MESYGYFNIIRLNKDGSWDNNFSTKRFENGCPNVVKIQEDQKIIAGGVFDYTLNGVERANIVRLDSNGNYDDGFTPGIKNNSFNTPLGINCMLIDGDGKIVIAGGELHEGIADKYSFIMRLNADGTIDNSFDFSIKVFQSGNYPRIFSIARQSDGKILVGGAIDGVGPDYDHITPANSIFRLNSNGTVDTSFNALDSVKNYIAVIQTMKDDRLLLGRQSVGLSDSSFLRIFKRNGELLEYRVPVSRGNISRIIAENDSTFLLLGSFTTEARRYGLLRLRRILE